MQLKEDLFSLRVSSLQKVPSFEIEPSLLSNAKMTTKLDFFFLLISEMNMQIREIQVHDMICERITKEKEKNALLEKQKAEQELLQEIADNKVKRLKILAQTFVDPNNLEFEIEKALNERVTYEFSIDSNGNISKPSQNILKSQPLINDQ